MEEIYLGGFSAAKVVISGLRETFCCLSQFTEISL